MIIAYTILLFNTIGLTILGLKGLTIKINSLKSPIIILNQKLTRSTPIETFLYTPEGNFNYYILVIFYQLISHYSNSIMKLLI